MTITDESKAKHKGLRLKDAVEDTEALKGKPVHKQYTGFKSADSEDATGTAGATMQPSASELAKINEFTRKTVTADEVVAFETMSCNNIPDRDDDVFSKECVKGFAALEGNLSSVGKSYMVSHDKTKLPKGRIFDVGTKSVDSSLFLTNKVYVPNTDSNKEFIEGIDFGVNWAVSVGVQLGKASCTIPGCDAERFVMGMWCTKGHDKGAYYDPNSDEKDDWGYPLPCSPDDPNAAKCLCQFDDPRDFYELSQVFLGAQYFAELKKDPSVAQLVKAAKDLPIVGVSKQEALTLGAADPIPDRLVRARNDGHKILQEDGVSKWMEGNLLYAFDPETDEDAVCLGRPTEEALVTFAADDPNTPEVPPAGGSEDDDDPVVEPTTVTPSVPEGESMSKKAVQAAAMKAKLPAPILEKLVAHDGDEGVLDMVLEEATKIISTLEESNKALASKAAVGAEYHKALREDAIAWYCRANASGDKGVDTTMIERLLDAAGDDVDLVKSITADYKKQAEKNAPVSVRRSSFPEDPNARVEAGSTSDDPPSANRNGVVSRIHG